ncbi:DUF6252 family protein [Flavobacterium sp.]|jgi:hypothetical protein|uniref:DUF6252 family protein n=1 Tax=Flavobacterium sp. TaxID=239 RepID=UPI002A828432|nr:DUF6252 family protein [Flavobacterium sp.]
MKNIIYLFLTGLIFSACTNDVQTNNPAFQAKFNDATWRALDARVSLDDQGRFVITAYTQYETVVLRTSSANPGTYVLGTTNQDNYVSYDFDGQGIFSSHDTSLYEGPAYKISNIVNSGTGYSNSNNSQTTPVTGSGSGLKLAILTNATSGNITSVSIVSRGDGYVAGDIVSVVGGNNNATVRILNTQQSNGEIVIEEVENGKYTGSFKFNAVSSSGEVITFSSGVFYKLSEAGL